MLLAFIAAAALGASAFSYDATAPLRVTTLQSSTQDGVRKRLVTFASGPRVVRAEIVSPSQPGRGGPGVLFVHWLGDDATTNHREFEPDARALARRGATCVLIDAMWSTLLSNGKDWFTQLRSPDTDYANSIAQVIDLRRALDVLEAQPGVDATRIAYVGHDFGSMYGAVLSGVDPRPRYYVLMAGTTTFAQWYLLGKKPADVAAYTAHMTALDPLPYLARSSAQGFMFQFAAHDQYVSAANAEAFSEAAPLPRATYVYDSKHDLAVPLAMHDRLSWLGDRLFSKS
ncbi:MAG: hypothetical protein JO199_11495 [Candidatus Eremiobacteraeota bacterium]|nr:hypothetical protein [Candidatus Eremiobacteraeota bacterium]